MNSIYRLYPAAALSVLLTLTVIIYWVPAQAQPQIASVDIATLQKDLESVYQKVRIALKTKNYEAFMALCEPPAGKQLTKAQWPEASEGLAGALPEASKMRFIRLTPRNNWVGYFFQELDNDPNYVTVSLFRFHREGQNWKFYPAVQSNSILKGKTDAENNAEIQKWIVGLKDIEPLKR